MKTSFQTRLHLKSRHSTKHIKAASSLRMCMLPRPYYVIKIFSEYNCLKHRFHYNNYMSNLATQSVNLRTFFVGVFNSQLNGLATHPQSLIVAVRVGNILGTLPLHTFYLVLPPFTCRRRLGARYASRPAILYVIICCRWHLSSAAGDEHCYLGTEHSGYGVDSCHRIMAMHWLQMSSGSHTFTRKPS